MQPDRSAGTRDVGLESAQQVRAYSSIAELRQQGDVDNAELGQLPIDVQLAGRLLVDQDQVERRVRKLPAIRARLGSELHLQKSRQLGSVPAERSQLFGTGAGVQFVQESFVGRGGRPQGNGAHDRRTDERGGKTPCRAMQKLTVR